MEVHATLDADPRCVREARRLTRNTLDTWGLADLGEIAVLLVSELTTNAILHARSPVGITMQTQATGVHVAICDDSPIPPRVRWFSSESATGRGIRLLNTLASTWGVAPNPSGGKCVWFTLADGATDGVDWERDVGSVDAL